jgi:hypothetical protein
VLWNLHEVLYIFIPSTILEMDCKESASSFMASALCQRIFNSHHGSKEDHHQGHIFHYLGLKRQLTKQREKENKWRKKRKMVLTNKEIMGGGRNGKVKGDEQGMWHVLHNLIFFLCHLFLILQSPIPYQLRSKFWLGLLIVFQPHP